MIHTVTKLSVSVRFFITHPPTDAAFIGFKTVADVTATEASTLRTILLNHAIGR
jgi:phage tail sheath protein FI